MIKYAFFFVFVAVISLQNAPAQIINAYGIKVAYTSAGQQLDHNGHTSPTERRNGFNAAVYAERSYAPFLSLLVQIEYAQRGAGMHYAIPAILPFLPELTLRFTRLDYLSVPVFVKLSIPAKVLSPYVTCGPRCDFLLGYKDDHIPQPSDYYEFKKVSFGASVGGGLELKSILPVGILLEFRYNFDFTGSPIERSLYVARNNSYDLWVGLIF